MKDGKLAVAVSGAGWAASAHAACWIKSPRAEIVAVYDIDRQKARNFVDDLELDCKIRDSFDELTSDDNIDIISISGPHHVHTEQAIAAAEAGKHVYIEKPICLDMQENRALRDAVKKAGVKSMVGFEARWNLSFRNIKAVLEAGAIGKPFYYEVDYWHGIHSDYTGWEWIKTKDMGRSAMLSAGCHAVDALRWFSGQEVVEVSAFGNNTGGRFEYEANAVAILKFADGAIGKTSALFDCKMPYTFNIDIVGLEGGLRDDKIWSNKLFPGQTDWARIPTNLLDSGDVAHHPYEPQINDFIECILQDRESHCNVADAFYSHELCIAIDRSIEQEGKPVKLPLQ
ncbi:MAG: Gfo/Idh/MocA family oxidoreductase [Planctomycetota bacterium]|nr:MAG: Gfo/Idh/MocA family oxidoreductase [Planctomycetota bacterium]